MKPLTLNILIGVAIAAVVANSVLYKVSEGEQVIITQFGQRIGAAITTPGLHLKTPFVQKVNRFEKRILEWDGPRTEMATKDKLFIFVDTFARWKITDSPLYQERLGDERRAQSRLDDILGGVTLAAVAGHDLIEIIRTTKDRHPAPTGEPTDAMTSGSMLQPIQIGRPTSEHQIFEAAKPKLAEWGIDLLDVRFKRINYNPKVEKDIFARMISERKQIAERYRSEGAGEASRILGSMEKEVNRIESEAYRKIQTITGEADAKATGIYAAAFNRSESSREFYRFLKTMETYRTSLGGDTTVILSTDSPFLRYLRSDTAKPQTETPSRSAP